MEKYGLHWTSQDGTEIQLRIDMDTQYLWARSCIRGGEWSAWRRLDVVRGEDGVLLEICQKALQAESAATAANAERASVAGRAESAAEAEHALLADRADSAMQADNASYAENAGKAAHALRADNAANAASAASATRALQADQAEHAINADKAANATNAGHAGTADHAAHAVKADSADMADKAKLATRANSADEAKHAAQADSAKEAARAEEANHAARADNAQSAATADRLARTLNIRLAGAVTGSGVFDGVNDVNISASPGSDFDDLRGLVSNLEQKINNALNGQNGLASQIGTLAASLDGLSKRIAALEAKASQYDGDMIKTLGWRTNMLFNISHQKGDIIYNRPDWWGDSTCGEYSYTDNGLNNN